MEVVLIDNDADMGQLFLFAAEAAGISARVFQNGLDAIKAVYKDPPDVILVDLGLAEMDGVRVIRQLRRNERLAHKIGRFEIIVYTGYDLESEVGRKIKTILGTQNVTRFYIKPYPISKLLSELK